MITIWIHKEAKLLHCMTTAERNWMPQQQNSLKAPPGKRWVEWERVSVHYTLVQIRNWLFCQKGQRWCLGQQEVGRAKRKSTSTDATDAVLLQSRTTAFSCLHDTRLYDTRLYDTCLYDTCLQTCLHDTCLHHTCLHDTWHLTHVFMTHIFITHLINLF